MKRSGRTLKQRLYGLRHLPSRLRRVRHFRGHGVHSPFVYSVVRHVFMHSKLYDGDRTLYASLLAAGVAERRAMQLQNLVLYCATERWAIDEVTGDAGLIILTLATPAEALARYAEHARECEATLCIIEPYRNAERWAATREIIARHKSTTIDNRAYVLMYNNHLPRQHYRL